MQSLITLTTDFGWGEYVAAMKGVIISINPKVNIIDINHGVAPQNIIEGAYILYSTVPYFHGGIHVAVVDPGVGTERDGLIIVCKSGILVGPDNGLLIPCGRKLGFDNIFRITNLDYCLENVSNTFHGRDIFAPVAAHLSRGVSAKEIGEPIEEYVDLKLEDFKIDGEKISSKVIAIDHFGNVITGVPKAAVEKHFTPGIRLELRIHDRLYSLPFIATYGSVEKGALMATISSSGFFEISCSQGSAEALLGVKRGEKIRIAPLNRKCNLERGKN